MTFGEHTALVEEVIDFAFSGRVLFAVGPPEETASAWITDDLRLALEANAGESEISRFQMAPQQDVSGWGNTDLLGQNRAAGDDVRTEDVAEDLLWGWHDLTENLVAELIWTSAYWQRPDRKALHDPLFTRFISSSLEKDLRCRLVEILPVPGRENVNGKAEYYVFHRDGDRRLHYRTISITKDSTRADALVTADRLVADLWKASLSGIN